MLSSGILDFAIGMVFTFLAVSLAAGSVTEAVASALNWRARTLLQGIKNLLNDPNFNALAGELYQHGLINPRGDGSKPGKKDRTNPSYIDSGQFAAAFLDIIKGLPSNTAVQAPAAPQQAHSFRPCGGASLATFRGSSPLESPAVPERFATR